MQRSLVGWWVLLVLTLVPAWVSLGLVLVLAAQGRLP
jgi:hypothetical protein